MRPPRNSNPIANPNSPDRTPLCRIQAKSRTNPVQIKKAKGTGMTSRALNPFTIINLAVVDID